MYCKAPKIHPMACPIQIERNLIVVQFHGRPILHWSHWPMYEVWHRQLALDHHHHLQQQRQQQKFGKWNQFMYKRRSGYCVCVTYVWLAPILIWSKLDLDPTHWNEHTLAKMPDVHLCNSRPCFQQINRRLLLKFVSFLLNKTNPMFLRLWN